MKNKAHLFDKFFIKETNILPAKITDLSATNVTGRSVKLIFTPINALYYEVRVNSQYFAKVLTSGQILTGLPSGVNLIDIRAISTDYISSGEWSNQVSVEETDRFIDIFGIPTVAFSLQKLKKGSEPSVVRVRRDSDNLEQDFKPTQITDGTLATFVGGGDGFVTVWYDQSGSNIHAIQDKILLQPLIVKSGIVHTTNGRPSISFYHSVVSYLFYNYTHATPVSSFLTIKQEESTGYSYILGASQSQVTSIAILGFNGNTVRNFLGAINQSGVSTKGDHSIYSIIQDSSNSTIRLNTSTINSTNNAVGVSVLSENRIGGIGVPAAQFRGVFQEIIIYSSNKYLSVNSIELDINLRYNIY